MDSRNLPPFKQNWVPSGPTRTLLVKAQHPNCQVPLKAHHDDAGFDLYCVEDTIIWPKCAVDIDTGWDIKVPDGHWGLLTARSSTFKRRRLVVAEGVIDPGYTGRCTILIWNPGFLPKMIRKGERLAQLVIIPLPDVTVSITDTMPKTSRGAACFGSTGN